MAIQQDGKRGRPIEWGKLFDKYNRKVNYWSRTYKTTPKDKIEHFDSFRERILSVREKYGLSSEQAVRLLGQQAGLGASLKQLDAYMAGAAKLGIAVDLKAATKAFIGGVIRDVSDIEAKMAADLGEDWTLDDLSAAVATGKITLSEANYILRSKYSVYDSEDRAHWISQNVFGSM